MVDITIKKLNEVHFRVLAEKSIIEELRHAFTFKAHNYKFHPKFKAGFWNGDMYLINKDRQIYIGLLGRILEWIKNSGYTVEVDPELTKDTTTITKSDLEEFINLVPLKGGSITLRDYQFNAILDSINERRRINKSCTGSGKSAIIYYLARWYSAQQKKILIIVPSVNLVNQMFSDFEDYANGSWNVESNVMKVYSGFDKDITSNIVISTWQSIYKQPENYFNNFYCIIGDEAHGFAAKEVCGMMEKATSVPVKIGTTGTIDAKNQKLNSLVLEGLFGKIYDVAKASDLIERNELSKVKIQCLVCKYPKEVCKIVSTLKYQKELDAIVAYPRRNKFIANLAAVPRKGVTLVITDYVEKHAEGLKVLIEERVEAGREVYYIHGGVDGDEREDLRQEMILNDGAVLVATYGTLSTGVNIPNITLIIFATARKGSNRLLQTIGRGLRLHVDKEELLIYDISDDFSYKGKKNTTLRHAAERMKIYAQEQYPFEIVPVKLG